MTDTAEPVLPHSPHDAPRWPVIAVIAVVAVGYLIWLGASPRAEHVETAEVAAHDETDGHHPEEPHSTAVAPAPAFYSVIPFAALLGGIAVLPLSHRTAHWWEHNSNRFLVAASLGAVTLFYYAAIYGHGVHDHGTHATSQPGIPAAATVAKNAILYDFIPFITLLFSLFVISGGISIEGNLAGRPALNTAILAIGSLSASFIGTTGAAMLLIRPLLKANASRRYVAHTVVFFIFIVCNTGGCLLPIGDPPLFLGYLKGVPFTWTLNLWKEWAFVNLALLAIYFVWDTLRCRGESEAAFQTGAAQPFAIRGSLNFLWLAGVIASVAFLIPDKTLPGTHWTVPAYFREVVMLAFAALSLGLTPLPVRRANHFNYSAIIEVAALFTGIFICMQPPLQILDQYGKSLGIDEPWKYFWGSGTLSSFLDNAPTYVVFFQTAKAAGGAVNPVEPVGIGFDTLAAISLGSVFMGANTYIGNGPNFMVKAIAEASNVRMPSFFGYMLYSIGVLVPLLVLVTLLFFV